MQHDICSLRHDDVTIFAELVIARAVFWLDNEARIRIQGKATLFQSALQTVFNKSKKPNFLNPHVPYLKGNLRNTSTVSIPSVNCPQFALSN